MKKYDVIVIGSGGGSKITSPAARLGYKVAVIEKDSLGGTCLNRGCIPSKMLIHPADIAHHIKNAAKFDISNDPVFTVNFSNLITRISETIDSDSEKIAQSYVKNSNIDYYKGTATFENNTTIKINNELITADRIVIAVGTRPHIPAIPGLTGTPFMTSTEALRNTNLPKSMIVIGGGYIGVELGYAYNALGCKTDFLIRSRLLRQEDSQVSEEFTKGFSQHHNVHIQAIPTMVEYIDNQFTVTFKQNDQLHTLSAEQLLIATGIVSNADTLELSNTDIRVNDKNFIQVDEFFQTTAPNVYAIGDCIGKYFFRHSVNFEGEYLFNELFGQQTGLPVKYPPVPHAVFSNPQVAGVGKTEDDLIADNREYVIGLNAYKNSAMGMALLSEVGFCKILFDRYTKKILGAHIVGEEASNMIHMLIAFMYKDGTLDDLISMIYIHPALPEIIRNAARKAKAQFDQIESQGSLTF